MANAGRTDLDSRLEAYFATLRASPFKQALKRSVANWQVYAAVSGSAMAMATGASAAIISSGARQTQDRVASVRLARQQAGSSKAPPFLLDTLIAGAREGDGLRPAAACSPARKPCLRAAQPHNS